MQQTPTRLLVPANVSTACGAPIETASGQTAPGTSVFMFDETVDSEMQVGCCKCKTHSLVHVHLPVVTEVSDRGTVTELYFQTSDTNVDSGLSAREAYTLA